MTRTMLAPAEPRQAWLTEGQGPVRGAIVRHIEAHPGLHKSALCRDVGISWGAASHHLNELRRQGALEVVQSGGRTCLFPPGTPAAEQARLRGLQDAATQAVLRELARSPGLRVNDLATALQASRRVVARRLEGLLRLGLVERHGVRNLRHFLVEPRPRLGRRKGSP